MQSAYEMTFERTLDHGNYQIGVIGTMGANAFMDRILEMQLEFPMLTMAEELQSQYTASGLSCADYYTG